MFVKTMPNVCKEVTESQKSTVFHLPNPPAQWQQWVVVFFVPSVLLLWAGEDGHDRLGWLWRTISWRCSHLGIDPSALGDRGVGKAS